MKQKVIQRHGTIRAFAVAIDKNHVYVGRVIGLAHKGEPMAVAKVSQWLGEPLRLWSRRELEQLANTRYIDKAMLEDFVSKDCPKANLLSFFNKVSEPKKATPLYLSICKHLGLPPYKQD